jgi:hypothetical protein
MAKPVPLFPRGESAVPLAPMVAEEIAAAESELAALEAGRGDAALSAMSEGGDVNAIAKLNSEAANIRVRIFNLQAAYRTASVRDARQAAEERYRRQIDDLAAFEAALAEKDAAVAEFCEAVQVAAESYRLIHDMSDAIAVLLPEACKFPAGMSAFAGEVEVDGRAQAAPLDHLAAHEFYRHSGIERPGQGGALPGSKPFSLSTIFRADAIEPWQESTKRLSAYLAEAVKNQIEHDRQIELRAIEINAEESAVA